MPEGIGPYPVLDDNYQIQHNREQFSEYHISLHPRAILDGIGETAGGGWLGLGTKQVNFSVDCVALRLDYTPEAEVQEQLLSYCTPLVNLRGLFEPTALLFGIPGNIVGISACLNMSPLRPASLLLALIAIGDLCALVAGVFPSEGNFYLSRDHAEHMYWLQAVYTVASAFPHYALAALSVERACIAWRPIIPFRVVSMVGAMSIAVTLGIFSVIMLPFFAATVASSYVGDHEVQMHVLIVSSLVPGVTILTFCTLTVVGLFVNRADQCDVESLASQLSIVMANQQWSSKRLKRQVPESLAGTEGEDPFKENPTEKNSNQSAFSKKPRGSWKRNKKYVRNSSISNFVAGPSTEHTPVQNLNRSAFSNKPKWLSKRHENYVINSNIRTEVDDPSTEQTLEQDLNQSALGTKPKDSDSGLRSVASYVDGSSSIDIEVTESVKHIAEWSVSGGHIDSRSISNQSDESVDRELKRPTRTPSPAGTEGFAEALSANDSEVFVTVEENVEESVQDNAEEESVQDNAEENAEENFGEHLKEEIFASQPPIGPACECEFLPEHSSLTRMALLASLTFFLMVCPLSVVTLVYHEVRGTDASQPVKNPLSMLRLLYLYELFAWIATLQSGIKTYVYLLAAPRFRKHFIFMMMRHTKGLAAPARDSKASVSRVSTESRKISDAKSKSTTWETGASVQDMQTSPMTKSLEYSRTPESSTITIESSFSTAKSVV
ncbi:hypothetical protein EGW08_017126 [Elysia chlorotica]|uniref:G-protein coupled receptors family 1 profile domain-containing protein n=1 Tax=Elysia chlorotica TaxID=188477 RepID=A0A433T0Q2_ELYCH|nr:hypothetical protein EGW08_017126 [Elysia chlorotica]